MISSAIESGDARPLSVSELLSALNNKFLENYQTSATHHDYAKNAERLARKVSETAVHLRALAGGNDHQKYLADSVYEIFGDSVTALYLSCCGLVTPAKMLMRRSLELGMVVVSYWDNPAAFHQWREHDGDIRFSDLLAGVTTPGYLTYASKLTGRKPEDIQKDFHGLAGLYSALSNVVHPKPYNMVATNPDAYGFDEVAFKAAVSLSERTYGSIYNVLNARFNFSGE